VYQEPVRHHEPARPARVQSGEREVFYEGEDPYVQYHGPVGTRVNAPDYHGEPGYDEPSYYEPSYDEGTHYAAAEPEYHAPSVYHESEDPYIVSESHHHTTVYRTEPSRYSDTDSVYESTHGHSSANTSRYGETSYRSVRSPPRYVEPARNYDNVEPYRPDATYQPPSQPRGQLQSDLPDGIQINYNADATSYAGNDDDIVINIFNGVGVPKFGRQIEYQCQPGTHECRPQCPEARLNPHDGTVTVNWLEDAAGCEHYAKPA